MFAQIQVPGTPAAVKNGPDGISHSLTCPSKWAIETYVVYDRENLMVQWSENEVDLTRIMTFVKKSAEIQRRLHHFAVFSAPPATSWKLDTVALNLHSYHLVAHVSRHCE